MTTTSFLLTLLYSVRVNGAQLLIESSSEVAISSFFGSYDERLFREYGLFGKDISYGGDYLSLQQGEEELKNFLMKNMGSGTIDFQKMSLIGVSEVELGLLEYESFTDQGGLIIMEQIRELMKTEVIRAPIGSSLSYLKDFIAENEQFDVMEEMYTLSKDINFYDDLGDEYGSGIDLFLEYMTFDIGERIPFQKSEKVLEKKELFSEREVKTGNLTREIKAFSLEDQIILDDYIRLYFGQYLSPKDRALQFETEYIIIGKENDQENMKAVIQRIFMIQWAYHYVSLLQNTTEYMKANTLALLLVGYLGEPAITMTTQLILLHNGYKEAEKDLNTLIKGEKIKLEMQGVSMEVDYKDYLQGLLLLEPIEQKIKRMINLIETNLRMEDGYQNMHIDHLVTHMSMRVNAKLKHQILPLELEYSTYYGYE